MQQVCSPIQPTRCSMLPCCSWLCFILPRVPGNGAALETHSWVLCSRQCLVGYKPLVNHVLYKVKLFDPRLEGCHIHLLASHVSALAYIHFMTHKQGKDLHQHEFCVYSIRTHCVCGQTGTFKKLLQGSCVGSSSHERQWASWHGGCMSLCCCSKIEQAWYGCCPTAQTCLLALLRVPGAPYVSTFSHFAVIAYSFYFLPSNPVFKTTRNVS